MLRTKKTKVLLVLAMVWTLLFPYTTPILAAEITEPYKQSDFVAGQTVLNLLSTRRWAANKYYLFKTAGPNNVELSKHIYKIYAENCYSIPNAIYCVDAEKEFVVDETANSGFKYKNFGDFLEATPTGELKNFLDGDGTTENPGISDENYAAMCWMAKNMYIQSADTSEGNLFDQYLENIFQNYIDAAIQENLGTKESLLSEIKENISVEDINVIQQYALWYFSNPGYTGIAQDTTVTADCGYSFTNVDYADVKNAYKSAILCSSTTGNWSANENNNSYVAIENPKKNQLNMILSYLITNAKNNTGNTTTTNYPSIDYDSTQNATAVVDGSNYKIGPFKIDVSGEVDSSTYRVSLTDGENDLEGYTLKDDSNNTITLEQAVGKKFYVYIPTTTVDTKNIKKIKLEIEYLQQNTEASFWKRVDDNGTVDDVGQPVIWITRNPKEAEVKEVPIEKGDLALRKYIVDENSTRAPKVDATGLLTGDANAKYKHRKDAVIVNPGDKITYELRIYNEGTIDATVQKIRDIIPEGLIFDTSLNSENWEYNSTTREAVYTFPTTSTNNVLAKRDADSINGAGKDTITGGLSTVAVQITLRVDENAKPANIFTNVAEIAKTNIIDKDSTPNNVTDSLPSDLSQYNGNANNTRNNLKPSNSNAYFEGLEDDDDFEKVIVDGKVFDLSLMKYIVNINGEEVTGRDPVVDVSPLKNGRTDATYTTAKTPVVVEQGDIVTYTIRVYNEGDIDGFAEEISDFIPEGLGFIVGHKTNVENYWSASKAIEDGAQTVSLSSVNNALNHVKLSDFENVTSLDDVMVVKGKARVTSTALSSNISRTENLIKAFDSSTDTNKTFANKSKYIQVTCVVLEDKVESKNFRNIAEISDDSISPDGTSVVKRTDEFHPGDRDSTPNSIKNPNNYTDEDDDDYEDLTIENKVYDLALQKFITALDGKKVDGREPTVTENNGKIVYNHSTQPLQVANNQLVEYTIRVYNEGETDAYAAEVADNIPNGLTFVKDNEINIENGWYLADKNGNETTDLNQAVTIRTKKLSKEVSEKEGKDNLIRGFKNYVLDYRDLKIVFKVNESAIERTKTTEKRIIKNIAEITEETDKKGTPVIDIDSTPDNWNENEDDNDIEKIYIKFFDLSLKKNLVKVIVMENGTTTEYNVNADQLFKVEINKKKLNATVVKFVYQIEITNDGEIDGYAKEIKDYIPDGLEFISDDNSGWYKVSDKVVATDALANTLLKANGGKASVNITLKWINGENNLGKKTNVAEISADDNAFKSPDVDSVPDNRVPDEDDIDNAPVILSISTGSSTNHHYGLVVTVSVIMITGIALIKKYVL